MTSWWNVGGISDLFVEVKDLPEGLSGLIQLIGIGFVYAAVLLNASNMISDGSELRKWLYVFMHHVHVHVCKQRAISGLCACQFYSFLRWLGLLVV